MERLIILVIWVIGITFFRNANTKTNKGKTKTIYTQQKRKNVFTTIAEEFEKEKRRFEQSTQPTRPAQPARPVQSTRPAQSSILSNSPKPNDTSKPKEPHKPVGLEADFIGGDEEIGGINEANISLGSKNNKLDLDLRKDLLKGIIYSEILSEPKSLRNMKRRTQ